TLMAESQCLTMFLCVEDSSAMKPYGIDCQLGQSLKKRSLAYTTRLNLLFVTDGHKLKFTE
ncbi:hypothetical protein QUH25_23870, partial [Klebsiella pneumoniae]